MSRPAWIVVLLVLAGGGIGASFLLRGSGEPPRNEVRREGFERPQPTDEEKNAYLFDVFRSGSSLTIGDTTLASWQLFGEVPLQRRGTVALDYLFDPRRFPAYRATPYVLLNTLRMIMHMPEARAHPRYEEFLRYWLDPSHAPGDTPGSSPATEFRTRILMLFTKEPPAWAAPYCEQELARRERKTDLRRACAAVLLHLGKTEWLVNHFDELPPNEAEPEVHLRQFVLFQLRNHAAPQNPESRRAGVRPFESILKEALRSKEYITRANAASTLLRLGDPKMVEVLLGIHEEAKRAGDLDAAWSTLLQLSDDSDDPRVRAICDERLASDPENLDFTYRSALEILATHWLDDEKVRSQIWNYIRAKQLIDLPPLIWLSRFPGERENMVAELRDAIRDGNSGARAAAIRFATHRNYPLPEVLPEIFELARRTRPEDGRDRFIASLVSMRFRPVLPLLIADLEEDDPRVRAAAASSLLEFGDAEGVRAVAEKLDAGDAFMLGPVQQRARAGGAASVDEALLPALLRLLERAPGETVRQRALLTLRFRGTLDGVEEGLMEAYRREPSSRVADAIRDTIIDLAHR
ncbi:MAG: HEAT repeat domain-containing protein [Planctomycetota bacterium]|jgi:HEAT repeat protein